MDEVCHCNIIYQPAVSSSVRASHLKGIIRNEHFFIAFARGAATASRKRIKVLQVITVTMAPANPFSTTTNPHCLGTASQSQEGTQ